MKPKKPHNVVTHGTYAELILTNIKNEEVGRALVDLEDLEKVLHYRWVMTGGYARHIKKGTKTVHMHRLILDAPSNLQVDHINGDRLDNRKCNLRLATNQQNSFNKGVYKHNKSGVTGVSWQSRDKRWKASIKVNQKLIHLGNFSNKLDAIKARKEAEKCYFGDFRPR